MRAKLDKLLLLFRTLIWLKPVQIYGRIWFRLYRPKPREIADVRLQAPSKLWHGTARASSMAGPDTFTFLNRRETLVTEADWNAAHLPKLWLYNAHYFDDLVAEGHDQRRQWHRDLIQRWIAENPPGTGNGWEPYPTSLRIVNWVKWLASGNAPVDGMIASLAMQADWLSRRLEFHLLGNHLFANAKALTFAGSLLKGPQADRWLKTGLGLLKREVPEQILPDGGHFERSIMYHAILTEDVLDLVQLAQLLPDRIPSQTCRAWEGEATGMLNFLKAMSHPDGRIAFFNDGAFGIAPEPVALFQQGDRLGVPPMQPANAVQHFPDTGYARLSNSDAVLLADTAPVGPDYLPGHAHADTLCFEFSLDGQRVFVNGGTSVYGGDPQQRQLERSTCYHNALSVNGTDSSEIWAEFRVARRAKISDITSGEHEDTLWLEASHDGYRRLNGPLHTRRWELSKTSLTIHDSLEHPVQNAVARFRVHPDLSVTLSEIIGSCPISITAKGGTLAIEGGTWSPEFGKTVPCQILTLSMTEQASSISFTWQT